MAARLDYRWHLRKAMADRGMFATTDLIGPLAQRGIRLSSSQVYRLVLDCGDQVGDEPDRIRCDPTGASGAGHGRSAP
jgi:hypothetical protein